MLLRQPDFLAALRQPDCSVRLWLACGRDAGVAADLARRARLALAAAGADSTVHLAAAALEADPGRLADSAASIPLFGGRQLIRVDDATDRIVEAVRLLLESPAGANPVVMLAGDLAASSPLLELARRHPLARLVQAWPPGAREWPRLVAEAARAAGLRLARGQDGALWAAADGNPQILAREIEKLATAVDATPDRPAPVPEALFAALVGGVESESLDRTVAALLAGDGQALDRALAAHGSASAIPLLRAAARRLLLLKALRRAVDQGASPQAAIASRRPPVNPYSLRDTLADALPRWPMARIESALAALLEAERAVKAPASAGDILAHAALVAVGCPPRPSPPSPLGVSAAPS